MDAFRALESIKKPGAIIELSYKWKATDQEKGEK
jgi:hypothetical protein